MTKSNIGNNVKKKKHTQSSGKRVSCNNLEANVAIYISGPLRNAMKNLAYWNFIIDFKSEKLEIP